VSIVFVFLVVLKETPKPPPAFYPAPNFDDDVRDRQLQLDRGVGQEQLPI
jgi:hypothetical protein